MSVTFRTDGNPQLDSSQLVQGQNLPSAELEPEVRRVLIEGLGQGRNEKLSAKAAVHGQSPLDIKNEARPILDQHVIGQGRAKAMALNMLAARDGVNADGLVISGPAGTGKTQMLPAIAEAVNGDPSAYLYVNLAGVRTVADVQRVIGTRPGFVGGEAVLDKSSIERQIGQGTLILALDEIDKLNPECLFALAQFLVPLFVDHKLKHPDGTESEHLGAIVSVVSHNPGDGQALFSLIRQLAAAEGELSAGVLLDRTSPKPLKFEKLDQQGLTELAKRSLQSIVKGWPEGQHLVVDSDVAAHLAALAWKSGSVEKSGARELLGAVNELVSHVLSTVSEATPGSRFELKVTPEAKKDLAPFVQAFSQGKGSFASLGLALL